MTTPICRPRTERGFTLVEMLVVLVIIAIVGTAVLPRMGTSGTPAANRRAYLNARQAGIEARMQAMRFGGVVPLNLPSTDRGEPSIARGSTGETSDIIFYADGSSSGGAVTRAGITVATVDWLTGATIAVP